jgi:hypothetical protein
MKSSDSSNHRIILFFIDGLGVGPLDPKFNPCTHTTYGIFRYSDGQLPFDGRQLPLDACLDVDGLPQSGSGQTTIYTGYNAAKLIGRHLFGFPNRQLRELIAEESLFVQLTNANFKCKFINAFRPLFFTTPEIFRHMRMSATTEMNRAANLSFNTIKDISFKNALYHDFTNRIIQKYGFKLPLYKPEDAADILFSESKKYDLILYEYFMTDQAGHLQDMDQAVHILEDLERLIYSLVSRINQQQTSLIVISDHGNIEDLRTKSHTRNPAFMAVWGIDDDILGKPDALTDVLPIINRILSIRN